MAKLSIEKVSKDVELLQKILIVNLAQAGVPQNTIKKIVGVSTTTVNNIVKHFKRK